MGEWLLSLGAAPSASVHTGARVGASFFFAVEIIFHHVDRLRFVFLSTHCWAVGHDDHGCCEQAFHGHQKCYIGFCSSKLNMPRCLSAELPVVFKQPHGHGSALLSTSCALCMQWGGCWEGGRAPGPRPTFLEEDGPRRVSRHDVEPVPTGCGRLWGCRSGDLCC